MNRINALVIAALLFTACDVQKRHYLKGFYFGNGGKCIDQNTVKKSDSYVACRDNSSKEVLLPDNLYQVDFIACNKSVNLKKKESVALKTLKPRQKYHFKHPITAPVLVKKNGFAREIIPDAVPDAAVRLMLFSLLFLALAFGLFMLLPELVYITVGLLIMSELFALVSLIAGVNARLDKINNSKKGLLLALAAIIIDILITVGIVLFLILLF